jgi:hypothetical protein
MCAGGKIGPYKGKTIGVRVRGMGGRFKVSLLFELGSEDES